MDGLELCRRIRSLPYGGQSIILVISGSNTPKNIQAAMEAGADDFLSKPVSPELLSERLMSFMRMSGMMSLNGINEGTRF